MFSNKLACWGFFLFCFSVIFAPIFWLDRLPCLTFSRVQCQLSWKGREKTNNWQYYALYQCFVSRNSIACSNTNGKKWAHTSRSLKHYMWNLLKLEVRKTSEKKCPKRDSQEAHNTKWGGGVGVGVAALVLNCTSTKINHEDFSRSPEAHALRLSLRC